MTEKEKASKQPEKKFVAPPVAATVWKNKGKKDGEEFEFYTVSIERSYKDKDDEWQNTSSMRVPDLPKVALVANKAFAHIAMLEEEE